MRAPVLVALAASVLAVVALGVVADRGLRRDVADARLAEEHATRERAESGGRALRVALGQIEGMLAMGRVAGAQAWSFRLPPRLEIAAGGSPPLSVLPRPELARRLGSTAATPRGMPEAAVAALLLDSPDDTGDVAERLLAGELPVRADDVATVAASLGVGSDPRVMTLEARLREWAVMGEDVPVLPAYLRSTTEGRVSGWTRDGERVRGYAIPIPTLAAAAGDSVNVATQGEPASDVAAGTFRSEVPDLPGLFVIEAPRRAAVVRLSWLRGLLWLATALGCAALAGLAVALERQAAASRREREFLQSVTHELKTPLASLRLIGDALAEGRGDARDYGSLVASESARLESLVDRVLMTARRREREHRSVSLDSVLMRVIALMRPRCERAGKTLNVRAGQPVGTLVGDGGDLERALLNLVDNAVRHGGPNVAIEIAREGGIARICVSDDGAGIRRRDRRRVFLRFWRGPSEDAGTGLGLALVEDVVRDHGGRVELDSVPGRCAFTMVLPMSAAP